MWVVGRRDDGPPSPQSLPTSGMRAKVGVGVVGRRTGGAAPFSTKLGRAERAKVGRAERAKVGVE